MSNSAQEYQYDKYHNVKRKSYREEKDYKILKITSDIKLQLTNIMISSNEELAYKCRVLKYSNSSLGIQDSVLIFYTNYTHKFVRSAQLSHKI